MFGVARHGETGAFLKSTVVAGCRLMPDLAGGVALSGVGCSCLLSTGSASAPVGPGTGRANTTPPRCVPVQSKIARAGWSAERWRQAAGTMGHATRPALYPD